DFHVTGVQTCALPILLVHRQPSYFSFDQFKLLQMLAGNIGLSVSNAYLHAEIRKMVITDQLTGLYVRHYLYEQIELMQKRDACEIGRASCRAREDVSE